jgi:hypothetical protein
VQRRVARIEWRESMTGIEMENAKRCERQAPRSQPTMAAAASRSHPVALRCVLAAAIVIACVPACAGDAKGTITYKYKAGEIVVRIKHAYLFKGPDVVSGKTIRRVVLSVADVSAKLGACATMLCSDGDIVEGMTIDFDAGPRLNYWLVGNNQLMQYSGTAEPASLKLTADTPQRLAGKWDFDGSAAGGPKVQIEFDAPLVKEVAKLR